MAKTPKNVATEDEITLTADEPDDSKVLELEASLVEANRQLEYHANRADRAETELKDLKNTKFTPEGNVVYLDGVQYSVLNIVRADNTFHEVKRGHVNEGLTMVVIDKMA